MANMSSRGGKKQSGEKHPPGKKHLGSGQARPRLARSGTSRTSARNHFSQSENQSGDHMAKNRMGQGENRKLKADYGRDKTASPTPEERREVARRQGSSKKPRIRKSLEK